MRKVIQIDASQFRRQPGKLVRDSVKERLLEMYLTGGTVRRVEDITEAMRGIRVGSGTTRNLGKKIYKRI